MIVAHFLFRVVNSLYVSKYIKDDTRN